MATHSKWKEIEKRHGKPMSKVLEELYLVHDKQTEIAQALGVGQSTISTWLRFLGLKEKTILVKREETA